MHLRPKGLPLDSSHPPRGSPSSVRAALQEGSPKRTDGRVFRLLPRHAHHLPWETRKNERPEVSGQQWSQVLNLRLDGVCV